MKMPRCRREGMGHDYCVGWQMQDDQVVVCTCSCGHRTALRIAARAVPPGWTIEQLRDALTVGATS